MSTHEGVESGRWWGRQEIDFKMEVNHDWSPDRRLQDCAGYLAGV